MLGETWSDNKEQFPLISLLNSVMVVYLLVWEPSRIYHNHQTFQEKIMKQSFLPRKLFTVFKSSILLTDFYINWHLLENTRDFCFSCFSSNVLCCIPILTIFSPLKCIIREKVPYCVCCFTLLFLLLCLSDDRSQEIFRNTLEASTQMQSVLGYNEKPNCLVIDEIDGAPAVSINKVQELI